MLAKIPEVPASILSEYRRAMHLGSQTGASVGNEQGIRWLCKRYQLAKEAHQDKPWGHPMLKKETSKNMKGAYGKTINAVAWV